MSESSMTPAQGHLSLEEGLSLLGLQDKATPANTRKAYASDLEYIRLWTRFASEAELPWPATDELVLKFIAQHAPTGTMPDHVVIALRQCGRAKKPPAISTTLRRLAAWTWGHRRRNLNCPMSAPAVQASISALRNLLTVQPKSQNPITQDALQQLLDTCQSTALRDIRDTALFLCAYASGGRRRSELCALNVEDLHLVPREDPAYLVTLPPTKRRQKPGDRTVVAITGVAALAMQRWLTAAGLAGGPLFRSISRHDRVSDRRLTANAITHILRQRLLQADLPTSWASPHGFRSGFLTDAANSGVPERAAMDFAQISTPTTIRHYYRNSDLLKHPALLPGLALRNIKADNDPPNIEAKQAR